jgi:GxxExxY protein
VILRTSEVGIPRGSSIRGLRARICAAKTGKRVRTKQDRQERVVLRHSDLTERIVKAFYHVYNVLGHGFLEKVYENALTLHLRKQGLRVRPQAPIKVYFEGEVVGEYFADLLVNDLVIVELKAVEALTEEHHAQLINYLKASDIEVGLLVNFGPKPELKRKVYETARKQSQPRPDDF